MTTNTDDTAAKGMARLYRLDKKRWRALTLLPPLAGGALAMWSAAWVERCSDAHLALAFGIRAERVKALTAVCSADTNLTAALWIDVAAALVYGLGLTALLLVWWRYGWRSGSQRTFKVARAVAWLPLAAAVCDIVENFVGMSATPTDSGLDISEAAAQVAATAGIAKWLLLVAALFAAVLTLYGAWRFRILQLGERDPAPTPTEQEPVHGVAVCLSGGGIRSASFAWGALSQLSAAGIFPRLRSMYSVSGGGYAATAWTSSSGIDDPATFYEVTDDPDTSAAPTAPFQHVRRNNRYLDSRRGGIIGALALTVICVAINLSVIYAGIIVLTTLPALLTGSRFGSLTNRPVDATHTLMGVLDGTIRPGAWLPILWLLALAGAIVLVSFAIKTSRHRRPVLIVAAAVAATATAVFTITIGLPWLAHHQYELWEPSWWAALPAVITWVLGLVAAALRPTLSKIVIRLGGVVGVALIVLVLLGIMRNAVVTDSAWSSVLVVDADSAVVPWLGVMATAIAWLVAIDHTGVQWWSLHPLYRNRLATTFSMQVVEGTVASRPDTKWPRWSQLGTTQERPGPTHVVCAATHRRERKVTGLRAVSYRFSRNGVGYFEPCLNDDATIDIRPYEADAAWLDQSFGLKPGAPMHTAPLLKPHARSSAIAAAAMSGAAFNSVMGRQSKGSTDSLLAMLNLRLGVWMPNHRFATHPHSERKVPIRGGRAAETPRPFPRPGLRYLFHEVVGHYDLADPFIQVSDGGHWENLGLAEALRDRHLTIIAVDATGGKVEPFTAGADGAGFASLFEAIDLARMELSTELRINVTPMRPDPRTGRAQQNWAKGTVVYHRDRIHDWRTCTNDDRCPTGTLLFVKSVVCDRTPPEVLAYANSDRVFPDYSTADQFLSDDQFDALVRLGRSAMGDALSAYPVDASL